MYAYINIHTHTIKIQPEVINLRACRWRATSEQLQVKRKRGNT